MRERESVRARARESERKRDVYIYVYTGHTWLEDEGLHGASLEEVLIRAALRSQDMAMAYSHFHLLRRVTNDNAAATMLFQDATCADDAQRKAWRASVVGESESRGCLGQLEKLISQYPLTVSTTPSHLAIAMYAGQHHHTHACSLITKQTE